MTRTAVMAAMRYVCLLSLCLSLFLSLSLSLSSVSDLRSFKLSTTTLRVLGLARETTYFPAKVDRHYADI